MDKLQYRFRKKQFYKPYEGAFYYVPSPYNPLIADIQSGIDPDPRTAWKSFDSSLIKGDGLKLNYALEDSDERDTRGNNYKVGVSEQLLLFGEAATYIKDLLELDPFNALNVIEVEVYDVRCGKYLPIMNLDINGYEWCDEGGCYCFITIKETSLAWDCFAQKKVTDNTNNLFQDTPPPATLAQLQAGDPPYHPRIGYCNEIRPTIFTTWLVYILSPIFTLIQIINATVIATINLIIAVVNTLPGVSLTPIPPINIPLDDNILACNRVHYAPKIRHLLKNICDICELGYDDDIFNTDVVHPLMQDEIPSNFPNEKNPYYEALLYAPIHTKGDKMNDQINRHWDDFNFPILTGYDLIESLRVPFNLKWVIKNGKLVIRNKHFYQNSVVIDFTNNTTINILNNPCFQWELEKYPSFISGVYNENDSKDNIAREAIVFYNDVIENNKINSPQMQGEETRISETIGATGFAFDLRANQYLLDIADPVNGLPLFGIPLAPAFGDIRGFVVHTDDNVERYRVLIYDQYYDTTFKRAKVRGYECYESNFPFFNPFGSSSLLGNQFIEWNDLYGANNPGATPTEWAELHAKEAFKKNAAATQSFNTHLCVWNYPLMFDPRFKFNLSALHKLDQARYALRKKRYFELHLQLCCEVLDALKIWRANNVEVTANYNIGGAYYNDIAIDELIKYDVGQPSQLQAYTGIDLSNKFRIIEIEIDYSTDQVILKLKSV